MKIKQSLRIEVSDRTHVNRQDRSISLIENGEVLTLQFNPSTLDVLSELIEKLEQIERDTISETQQKLQKRQKHNPPVQLPVLVPKYSELEFY